MAEEFIDDDTGERFFQDATGAFINAASGIPEAISGGIISAAKDNILIAKGVTDILGAGAGLFGLKETQAALQQSSTGIQRIREEMIGDFERAGQEGFPGAFFIGEVGGSFLPGGPGVQAVIGGLQGVGFGDTAGEQVGFGLLNAIGGVFGARGGRAARQGISRQVQRRGGAGAQEHTRAAQVLQELNIPLRESDLAGQGTFGVMARRRDRLRQLTNPGADVAAMRSSLNEIVTDHMLPGSGQDAITSRWRTSMADDLNAEYNSIRKLVPEPLAESNAGAELLLEAMSIADTVPPDNRGAIRHWVDIIIDDYSAGKLDGQRWLTLRSNIATSARSADNFEASSGLYAVREQLDQLVALQSPEILPRLTKVNDRWRMNEVLDKPGVVNKADLSINPGAYTRNMKRMFPNIWRVSNNNQPDEAVHLFRIMEAAEQFPAFRSSGTGELLTAGSVTKTLSARAQLSAGSVAEALGGSA